MNHREVEEGNITELYLGLELSSEQEMAFEEHLLACETCRENLRKARLAYEAAELSGIKKFRTGAPRQFREKTNNRLFRNQYIRIAAAVLLLIGISSLTILIIQHRGMLPDGPALIISGNDSSTVKADSAGMNTGTSVPGEIVRKTPVQPALTENFIQSRFFENIISENVRNASIIIISPEKDTIIRMPEFRWKYSGKDRLTLVLINNREKELFRHEIENGTIPSLKTAPGLYYWQLQDEKETLATGKFILLPATGQ